MNLRRPVLVIVAAAPMALVSGCINVDVAHPQIRYHNRTEEDLRVLVAGAESTFEAGVLGGSWNGVPLEECVGSGIVVETTGGDVVGRVDEPACPGWTLTIDEDGSLTYREG